MVPKLNARGRLSYAALPLAGASFGGILGAAGSPPEDEKKSKGSKGKEDGKKSKTSTSKKDKKKPSTLRRALIGASIGGGLGGLHSANRYSVNATRLREYISKVKDRKSTLKGDWSIRRRGLQKDIRKYGPEGLDVLEEDQQKRILKALDKDVSRANKDAWRSDAQKYLRARQRVSEDTKRFQSGLNIGGYRPSAGFRELRWARTRTSGDDLRNTAGALNTESSKFREKQRADLKAEYGDAAAFRAFDGFSGRAERWNTWSPPYEIRGAGKTMRTNAEFRRGTARRFSEDAKWKKKRDEWAKQERSRQERSRQRSNNWSGSPWDDIFGGGRSANIDDAVSILGIKKDGTKTKREAKRAYKAYAMKHHPDRGGTKDNFIKGNEAWKKIEKSDWFDKLAFLRAQRSLGLDLGTLFPDLMVKVAVSLVAPSPAVTENVPLLTPYEASRPGADTLRKIRQSGLRSQVTKEGKKDLSRYVQALGTSGYNSHFEQRAVERLKVTPTWASGWLKNMNAELQTERYGGVGGFEGGKLRNTINALGGSGQSQITHDFTDAAGKRIGTAVMYPGPRGLQLATVLPNPPKGHTIPLNKFMQRYYGKTPSALKTLARIVR